MVLGKAGDVVYAMKDEEYEAMGETICSLVIDKDKFPAAEFSVMRLPCSWAEAREMFEKTYGETKWIGGFPESCEDFDDECNPWNLFTHWLCRHLPSESSGSKGSQPLERKRGVEA